jgi:glucose uptake protein GlcU
MPSEMICQTVNKIIFAEKGLTLNLQGMYQAILIQKDSHLDEGKDFEKGLSVLVIFEYGFFVVAPVGDMIHCAGIFYA